MPGDENKDKLVKEDNSDNIVSGFKSIDSNDFSEADEYFSKVLEQYSNIIVAGIGKLMAETRTANVDDLFDYYKNLFAAEEYEVIEACEEDTERISSMIEKYTVPYYLSEELIREYCDFDRTYKSLLACRKKQKEQMDEYINGNPVFQLLSNSGNKDIVSRIEDLKSTYANRLIEAESSDEENANRISGEYQRFMYATYQKVHDEYDNAIRQREDDYRLAVKDFNKADDKDAMIDLLDRFRKLDRYEDSKSFASLCRERIDRYEEQEKKKEDSLTGDDYYEQGMGELSDGKFVEAEDLFDKALAKDEWLAKAYLGKLMAQLRISDKNTLFEHYRKQFSGNRSIIKEACRPNERKITELIEKYKVDGYLNEDTIRRYCFYDRTYSSSVEVRSNQYEDIKKQFKKDPLIKRIYRSKEQDVIKDFDKVLKYYEDRYEEEKQKEKDTIERISKEYSLYLEAAEEIIAAQYQKALEDRQNDENRQNEEALNAMASKQEDETVKDQKAYDWDYFAYQIANFENINDYQDKELIDISLRELARQIAEKKADDETFLQAAYLSLSKDNILQAKEFYNLVLLNDPENYRAYFGLLLADCGCHNTEELVSYFEKKYQQEEVRFLELQPDYDHIDEMSEIYEVRDYFERDDIEKIYRYDLKYPSFVASRIRNKDLMEDYFASNDYINRIIELDGDDILLWMEDVLDYYDDRIAAARKQEKQRARKLNDNYRKFLKTADNKVEEKSAQAFELSNRNRKKYSLSIRDRFTGSRKEETRREKTDNIRPAYSQRSAYKEDLSDSLSAEPEEKTVKKEDVYVPLSADLDSDKDSPIQINILKKPEPVIEKPAQEITVNDEKEEEQEEIETVQETAEDTQSEDLVIPQYAYEALEEDEYEDSDTYDEEDETEYVEEEEDKEVKKQKNTKEDKQEDTDKLMASIKAARIKEEKERKKQERAEKIRQRLEAWRKARAQRGPINRDTYLIAGLVSIMLILLIGIGVLVYSRVFVPRNQYNEGLSLLEQGNYDEAITIFTELGNYRDAVFQAREATYQKAVGLYEDKEYVESLNILKDLKYKDSDTLFAQIKTRIISDAKIGDEIIFGLYEQDGDTNNGRENLVWIVLDKDEDQNALLAVTKYGVDGQKFNTSDADVFWRESSLRQWLNRRFLNNAFDIEDPSSVIDYTSINYEYNELGEEIEFESTDKVFVFSAAELEQYFPQPSQRNVEATEYAIKNGVNVDSNGSCGWWLRDAGEAGSQSSAYVWGKTGDISYSNNEIIQAVRPLIWISLDN